MSAVDAPLCNFLEILLRRAVFLDLNPGALTEIKQRASGSGMVGQVCAQNRLWPSEDWCIRLPCQFSECHTWQRVSAA